MVYVRIFLSNFTNNKQCQCKAGGKNKVLFNSLYVKRIERKRTKSEQEKAQIK